MPAHSESLTIVEHFRAHQRAIARAATDRVQILWNGTVIVKPGARPDRAALARKIDTFARSAADVVTAGQLAAAHSANQFVAAYAASELQRPVAPVDLDPREFTGPHLTDADAPLAAVLAASAMRVVVSVLRRGPSDGDPLRAGERMATRLALNETLEAGRAAVEAIGHDHEIDGHRTFSGWTRGVTATGCPACISLADGTVLSWNTTMLDHPRCSCVQIPAVGDLPDRYPVPTGRQLFDQLSIEQQDRIYGIERAAAVRAGAALDFADESHGHIVPAAQGSYP
jgi:hypothetical protein